jgi:signal transduction histidine kinase
LASSTAPQSNASTNTLATSASPVTARLDVLIEQLCSNTGLYSRETFQALSLCILRLLREQKLQGVVLTLLEETQEAETLEPLLSHLPNLQWFNLKQLSPQERQGVMSAGLSMVLILTDRLSGLVFWNKETEAVFKTCQGGWSFHPGDSRLVASQMGTLCANAGLTAVLESAPVDRRFDENLTRLISALVNNLESRNRDLSLALERENRLTAKVLETERLAAIGQLCSVIAHEIRNPLGLVALYAKLVEGQLQKLGVNEPAVQDNLGQIAEACTSLESILSELTQYSRPLTLVQQGQDIVALVNSVCHFMRPAFDEKNVILEVASPVILDEMGQPLSEFALFVDANRLRQALLNLLKNALEACENGKRVVVTVSSRRNDDQLYIRIEDQGSGVSAKAQAKLFTPYFSTKATGTGLGLAHVRKIMQAHGGNAVLLHSEPEKGSTFALVLPRSLHREAFLHAAEALPTFNEAKL